MVDQNDIMAGINEFEPRTPTEMALHQVIKKLQWENACLRAEKGLPEYLAETSSVRVMDEIPPTIQLERGAHLIADYDSRLGQLKIVAQTWNKEGRAEGAAYVENVSGLRFSDRANLAVMLHERFLRQWADRFLGASRDG